MIRISAFLQRFAELDLAAMQPEQAFEAVHSLQEQVLHPDDNELLARLGFGE
jgi:hypothetical protein